jgi:hypothetical protein
VIKKIPQLFLTAILFSHPLFSQTGETFSSWYGGFVVNLPPDVRLSGGGGLTVAEMGGTGDSYGSEWTGDGIWVEVHFIDLENETPPINAAIVLKRVQNAVSALRSASPDQGFKLLHDRQVVTNGHKGREVAFEGNMRRSVFRFYPTTTRIVRLHATYPLGNTEEKARKFLDTIKLAGRDEIAAQKIREATPAALPQTPPPNRAKPDKDLKGPVAKVIEEKQVFKNRNLQPTKTRTAEIEYDRRGYTTRLVSYDFDGHPGSIVVFGYIDGMRVSMGGSIKNERVFTGGIPLKPGVVPKPRDLRYSRRYEVKYDAEGRVLERSFYWNNGELGSHSVFAYTGDQAVIREFDDENALKSKRTDTHNEKGNVFRSVTARFGGNPGEYRTEYKYELYDRYGNWTKRYATTEYYENSILEHKRTEIQYRKITYWK